MLRRKRYIYLVIVVMLVVSALLLLFLYNPENVSFYPRCIFLKLTGFQCAGCGSLRFIHSILNGEFSKAWSYNPFLFLVSPFILLMLILSLARYKITSIEKLYRILNSSVVITILIVLTLFWWIYRNL